MSPMNLSMTGSLADRFKSGSQKAGTITVPFRIIRLHFRHHRISDFATLRREESR